jgi:hypothetical protein
MSVHATGRAEQKACETTGRCTLGASVTSTSRCIPMRSLELAAGFVGLSLRSNGAAIFTGSSCHYDDPPSLRSRTIAEQFCKRFANGRRSQVTGRSSVR